MAFTSTDLASIEAAIIEFATGTREVQVAIGGKLIKYAETDIDKLEALATRIKAALGTHRPRAYARNMKRATL